MSLNLVDFNFRIADQGIFNFPFIWHFNTWIAGILKLFLAIVIVSMMANEYSNRTLKQNLIDGLSKKEFVISKFLTVVLFSFVSTLFVFIVSLILGLIFSDYNEIGIIFSDTEYLLAYFINLVGFFFILFIYRNTSKKVCICFRVFVNMEYYRRYNLRFSQMGNVQEY